MKYIRNFDTRDDYERYVESGIDLPNVSLIKEDAEVIYNNNPSLLISRILIDQNISEPTNMISGDVNGEAIVKIRTESHRYLGKYGSNGVMTICQLDDDDSTKYADGSAATLTGIEGDVFVKLPQFYYKALDMGSNKWEIVFCYGYGKPEGDNWQKWDSDQLIGAYECYISNNKMYSIAGVDSSANIVLDNFNTYAAARGDGFTTVKWKHHNLMAFLFYAMYGTTNSQAVIGYGDGASNKIQGQSNSLGMRDTSQSINGSGAINFWGLENWWGNKWETIGDVVYQNKQYQIQEVPARTINNTMSAATTWPTQLYIGEHLDCIPTKSGGSGTTGYCDSVDASISGSKKYHICRGGRTAAESCGILNLVGQNYGASFGTVTSRLAFDGPVVTETDVQKFKALNNE